MADQAQATPFSAEPAPAVTAPAEPVQDPVPATAPTFVVPEAVQSIVGEGKKYATPEDALQSIPHAQHHIERLEEEMSSLREDLSKRKAVDEVLKEINKTTPELAAEPQLSQEQLDELIDKRLDAKTIQAAKENNINSVREMFVEIYGDKDKSHEVYVNKATELGISVDDLNALSARSPKAVYELFGLVSKETTASKIKTNLNSEAIINTPAPANPIKSVMGGSTSANDIAAWKAAAPTE